MLAKSATGSSKTVDEMIERTDQALNNDLMTIAMIYAQDTDLFTKLADTAPPSTDPQTILEQLRQKSLMNFQSQCLRSLKSNMSMNLLRKI